MNIIKREVLKMDAFDVAYGYRIRCMRYWYNVKTKFDYDVDMYLSNVVTDDRYDCHLRFANSRNSAYFFDSIDAALSCVDRYYIEFMEHDVIKIWLEPNFDGSIVSCSSITFPTINCLLSEEMDIHTIRHAMVGEYERLTALMCKNVEKMKFGELERHMGRFFDCLREHGFVRCINRHGLKLSMLKGGFSGEKTFAVAHLTTGRFQSIAKDNVEGNGYFIDHSELYGVDTIFIPLYNRDVYGKTSYCDIWGYERAFYKMVNGGVYPKTVHERVSLCKNLSFPFDNSI